MSETNYLSLKYAQAVKAGQRATGKISYRILTEEMQRDALFITIVGNEGGGWFSNEIVPLAKIETLLAKHDSSKPLATKFFAPAFNSKSVNNAGFLAAVLRTEGLLQPAEPGSRLHLVTEEWDIWKAVMLSEPAEAYEPPVKTPANAKAAEKSAPEAETTAKPKLSLKVSKKPVDAAKSKVERMALTTDSDAEEGTETSQNVTFEQTAALYHADGENEPELPEIDEFLEGDDDAAN